MTMTLLTLNTMLDELEDALPSLIEDNPDAGDFWVTFAGLADVIEDQAGDHCEQVTKRLAEMLAKHGRYVAVIDE